MFQCLSAAFIFKTGEVMPKIYRQNNQKQSDKHGGGAMTSKSRNNAEQQKAAY